jgi:hypothetical protein
MWTQSGIGITHVFQCPVKFAGLSQLTFDQLTISFVFGFAQFFFKMQLHLIQSTFEYFDKARYARARA